MIIRMVGGVCSNTVGPLAGYPYPVFMSPFRPDNLQVGVPFSFDASSLFVGNVTSYSINGTLPVGVSFDISTGILSSDGTALVDGSASLISISAWNGIYGTESNSAILVVGNAPTAPVVIASFTPSQIEIDEPWSYDISGLFFGNVSSYTVYGILPDGVLFDTINGILSYDGSEVALAAQDLYITATYQGAESAPTNTATLTLVNELLKPTVVDVLSPPAAILGESYVYDASSVFSGDVYQYSVNGDLPEGISLSSNSGIFIGTPTEYGSFEISVSAINSQGEVTSNIATMYAYEFIGFEFDLTQPLQAGTGVNAGYYMVYNESTGSYDARITNADGTAPDSGTDWPTVYPENGRIIGPYYIEPVNQPTGNFDLFYTRFVDVDGAGKWQDVLLSYDSAASTADVTVGDEANPLDTNPIYSQSGLLYTPPTTFRIGDDFILPGIPNATWDLVKNLDVGQTDEFYLSFITPPANFSLSNLSEPSEVSVANLVDYGWNHKRYVYGFDVTGVSAGSVSLTFEGSGQVSDSFGNLSTADSISDVITVSSIASTYEIQIDMKYSGASPAYTNTVNAFDLGLVEEAPLADITGNATGCTFATPGDFQAYTTSSQSSVNSIFENEMSIYAWRAYGGNGSASIYLEAGSYTVTFGSYNSAQSGITDFVFNGETKTVATNPNDNFDDSHNATFNVTSTGQIFALGVNINSGSDRAFLTAINIKKVG